MTLDELNRMDAPAAATELYCCCGSLRWVEGLLDRRPFRSVDALLQCADEVWWSLAEHDWMEAFTHHPRIGDIESLKKKFADTARWAASEQASVQEASEAILRALADGNREYEQRFGFIFIVCATGKTAEDLLAHLQSRLNNPHATELGVAAGEQAKITRLRLLKLLETSSH
ncbi:MAG: OHCU decarboxylase [Ignavibacteria bacterium]